MVAVVVGLLLAGCVMIDSKVSKLRPAAKGPESFAGVFENLASYRSESVLGLYQTEFLQEYFECFSYPERALDVRVGVDRDSITADIRFADGRVETRKLKLGQDCTFKDGYLVFPRKSDVTGGNDSPTLGFIGTGGARWTIDEDGSLVVVSYGGGAGTIGIVPVGGVVRWMAVFRRRAEATKGVPNEKVAEPASDGAAPSNVAPGRGLFP